jgi:hypothetical protein
MRYSRSPVARLRSHDRRHRSPSSVSPEASVTSNVGQSYPYTSESEPERAKRITALVAAREGLDAKLAAETTPLDANERWWVWKCPTTGCPGLLHAAGYARDLHAVYVVCDGTCAKTFLR